MRRFVLATAMCWMAVGAQAADMPDLPILRGGFTEGLSRTSVNWQGVYVGGQAAYGSSDENFAGSNKNMIDALLDHNVIQEMQVAQWNLGLGKVSARTPAYGAFVGYNWQWDDVVVGFEFNYMHPSNKFGGAAVASKGLVSGSTLSDGQYHAVNVNSSASILISDLATARARAGWTWGCFLPYIFAGVAFGNADISRAVTIDDAVSNSINGPFTSLATLRADEALHNHLVYGWTGGLGFDVNIVGGLFLRGEWEYVRITSKVDTSINTGRVGIGYKF